MYTCESPVRRFPLILDMIKKNQEIERIWLTGRKFPNSFALRLVRIVVNFSSTTIFFVVGFKSLIEARRRQDNSIVSRF